MDGCYERSRIKILSRFGSTSVSKFCITIMEFVLILVIIQMKLHCQLEFLQSIFPKRFSDLFSPRFTFFFVPQPCWPPVLVCPPSTSSTATARAGAPTSVRSCWTRRWRTVWLLPTRRNSSRWLFPPSAAEGERTESRASWVVWDVAWWLSTCW